MLPVNGLEISSIASCFRFRRPIVKVFNVSSESSLRSEPVAVDDEIDDFISLPTTFYAMYGKRLFDLVLAAVLLPIFLPIIFATWILTRMDGGPGFYYQKRVGRNGRLFNCWKVRTMVLNAEDVLREICASDPKIAEEWNRNQKLADDPRITKIGKFFRATSLDELPQIWNVICGDMSFIGPRPFMTSQEVLYRRANGKAYFLLRPGITGLWQVEGRGVSTFVERVRFDNNYLKGISFRSDISIVLKTIQVVLIDRTGN